MFGDNDILTEIKRSVEDNFETFKAGLSPGEAEQEVQLSREHAQWWVKQETFIAVHSRGLLSPGKRVFQDLLHSARRSTVFAQNVFDLRARKQKC